jgi:anti-sigma factor RsiW
MAAELHSPTPEELMEFVDGEGTPAARAGIEAHLATCPACQALAAQQRALSRDMTAWRVAPAPDSLHGPQAGARVLAGRWWRPRGYVMAGLSAAALIVILALPLKMRDAPRGLKTEAVALAGKVPEASDRVAGSAPRSAVDSTSLPLHSPAPPAAQTAVEERQAAHGPAVIRTATLQLVAKDFSTVRSAVERILDGAAGFADQLGVSADPGTARVLRGTLRVPGTQLTDVLTRLRALGQVTQDQQGAQDVADQLVDLDARLKSARATEQRLIDLLKNRTGKLSDVLEVEQELTRVRLDIERLDAEKTNMTRRVTYATIDLTISEERKAGLDPGPLPLPTQLRIAAADGLQNVVDTVVGLTLFILRAGPSLILWGFAGLAFWILAKRMRRLGRV